ncbi:GNAT family N-acetyltransferase [Paenibacillus sp. PCH8]|uniref:GNAT family N-acetyltransferase n=1 Tax=Paenibacillus sp. PCH8 TaxID=2066524 RepID=UPI000CF904F6|nr:GNAT family N-acetyltransferase [Paenibacillus sp. PCH8]PQP82244.1 GNAT family N-acetyltransferase [Paenibacillus sp. PCH8]
MNFVKYTEPDFEHYYSLVSNMEVMKQITEREIPEQEARTQFESMLDYNMNSACGHYRVSSEGHAGVAYAKLVPDEADPTRAEIGYMILPEHWGKGQGTSIASRLIIQAQAAGIGVLYAVIDPSNAASRQILLRQNFESTWTGDYDGLPGEILELNLQRKR